MFYVHPSNVLTSSIYLLLTLVIMTKYINCYVVDTSTSNSENVQEISNVTTIDTTDIQAKLNDNNDYYSITNGDSLLDDIETGNFFPFSIYIYDVIIIEPEEGTSCLFDLSIRSNHCFRIHEE